MFGGCVDKRGQRRSAGDMKMENDRFHFDIFNSNNNSIPNSTVSFLETFSPHTSVFL